MRFLNWVLPFLSSLLLTPHYPPSVSYSPSVPSAYSIEAVIGTPGVVTQLALGMTGSYSLLYADYDQQRSSSYGSNGTEAAIWTGNSVIQGTICWETLSIANSTLHSLFLLTPRPASVPASLTGTFLLPRSSHFPSFYLSLSDTPHIDFHPDISALPGLILPLIPDNNAWIVSLTSLKIANSAVSIRSNHAVFDINRSWISVPESDLKEILRVWDTKNACRLESGVVTCLCGQGRDRFEDLQVEMGGKEVLFHSEELLLPIPTSNTGNCLLTLRSAGIESGWVLGISFFHMFPALFDPVSHTVTLVKPTFLPSSLGWIAVICGVVMLLTAIFLVLAQGLTKTGVLVEAQQPLLARL